MHSHELKLYRGYANSQEVVVSGHVFRRYPSSKDLYDRKGFRYIRSVFRLFTVKTVANAHVRFQFGAMEAETRTLDDGYFRFALPLSEQLTSGWHKFQVKVEGKIDGKAVNLIRQDVLLVPSRGGYTIISDIDDTFLVSYSSHVLKKLYVMLTKNVESRIPFEDVVKHYQLLSLAGQTEDSAGKNTFFYVSSSEWNLYDYINRFMAQHDLPLAVLKLKKIKDNLSDFLRTGSGSHQHKQTKIEHIITFYPQHTFILMGDDSQHDPVIYENITKIFPQNIRAVYIRQTSRSPKSQVTDRLNSMADMGVSVCYFKHSNEAILHSVKEGIISRKALETFERKDVVLPDLKE